MVSNYYKKFDFYNCYQCYYNYSNNMETQNIQKVYTHDEFNKGVLDIKNNRNILKLVLNDGRRTKFMLIRNELALRDNKGNIPQYALQGEDIRYHYTYGKFSLGNKLTKQESNYFYYNFYPSGRIVFGDKIQNWTIYRNIEDIESIKDDIDKNMLSKLFNDIRKFNWLPQEDLEY